MTLYENYSSEDNFSSDLGVNTLQNYFTFSKEIEGLFKIVIKLLFSKSDKLIALFQKHFNFFKALVGHQVLFLFHGLPFIEHKQYR